MRSVLRRVLPLWTALSFSVAGPLTAQTTVTFTNGQTLSTARNTTGNNHTLTIASGSATQSGVISGSGSVTKTGDGTLILSAANTHTGATNVNAGTLSLGADVNVLSSSTAVTVAAGATLNLASFSEDFGSLAGAGNVVLGSATIGPGTNDSSTTFSGVMSGTGGLKKLGTGTLTLSGANTYSGSTTVEEGTLALAHSLALQNSTLVVPTPASGFSFGTLTSATLGGVSGSSALALTNASSAPVALTVGTANTSSTYSGTLSGGGSLTKSGTGTLTLNGHNTYSGGTTVSAGTLVAGTFSAIGPGHLAVASGATFDSGAFELDLARLSGAGTVTGQGGYVFDSGSSATLANVIAGSSSLTKSGPGTLTLAANNTYTGGTILAAGTLALGSSGALGPTGTISFTGGTLQFSAANTTDYSRRFSSASGQVLKIDTNGQSVTFDDWLFLPAGSLTKSGSGTLTLKGVNFLPGGVTLAGGTLALGHSHAIDDEGPIFFAGGTLQFSNTNTTDYSARFSPDANQAYRVDTAGQNVAFATALTSSGGSLTKSGAGTLTLTGNNTYTGGTTVEGGTLALGAGNALPGSGPLTITNGTLDVGSFTFSVPSATISGNGQITGTGTLSANSFNVSNLGTLFSNLAGSGALTKTGSSLTTLSGNNTYTGGTTLADGTLALGSSGALGSTGTISFTGGTLRFSSANTADYSARFSSAANQVYKIDTNNQSVTFASALTSSGGSLTKSGAGTLILNGANTYTGGTTISSGTLQIGATGSVAGHIVNDSILVFDRSSELTYGGVISGSGQVTKSGAATLILTGDNTYAGATTISSGSLQIGANGTTGSVVGDIVSNSSLVFNRSNDLTHGGAISGSGNVTKSGGGTLTLTSPNTFSGGATLADGILALGSAGAIGSTGAISFSGGTLRFSSANTADYSARFSSAANQLYKIDTNNQAVAFVSALTSAGGSLTKSGSGTLTLSGNSTYSGGTTLAAGLLVVASNTAIGTGAVLLDGGSLQASGGSITLANSLTLNADTTISGSTALTLAGPLTLARNRELTVSNTAVTTISGSIGQSGGGRSLNKYGAGELQLTAANTYSGGTYIGAGTVRINNSAGSAFGSGAVTVDAGATLTGAGTFTGALQLNGTYSPGNSPGTAHTGSQTWAGGGAYVWEISNATGIIGTHTDLLNISGGLTIAATSADRFTIHLTSLLPDNSPGNVVNFDPAQNYSFTLATASFGIAGFSADAFALQASAFSNPLNGGSWSLALSGNSLNLNFTASAIPEPSTYAAIFGACVFALAIHRRRKRPDAVFPRQTPSHSRCEQPIPSIIHP